MTDEANPLTGEVQERPGMDLVPLDLAALSEDELLAMFPTPVQAAGALLHARHVNARAPHALNEYRTQLQKAERSLQLAIAISVRELAIEYPRATLTERRMLAVAEPLVSNAQDARDTAWLLYEFARDYEKAIARDIEVLRSLNANFRTEHK